MSRPQPTFSLSSPEVKPPSCDRPAAPITVQFQVTGRGYQVSPPCRTAGGIIGLIRNKGGGMPDTPNPEKRKPCSIARDFRSTSLTETCQPDPPQIRMRGGPLPANRGDGYPGHPPTLILGGYDRSLTQKGEGVSGIPPFAGFSPLLIPQPKGAPAPSQQ